MLNNGEYSQEIIRSSIKLVFRLIVLWVIRIILFLFPSKTVIIQNIPLTFEFVVDTVFGLMVIIVILKFRFDAAHPMRSLLPTTFVKNIIINLTYIASIWVAYHYFSPILEAILPGLLWIFSLALIAAAIVPVAKMSIFFYKSVDKLTDIISTNLYKIWLRVKHSRSKVKMTNEAVGDACSFCGAPIQPESIYCSSCGSKLN